MQKHIWVLNFLFRMQAERHALEMAKNNGKNIFDVLRRQSQDPRTDSGASYSNLSYTVIKGPICPSLS